MLNMFYSKLLKLLSVVLLVMVFIIGFTKSASYAMSFDDFYYYVQDKYNTEFDNMNINFRYYLGKWLNGVNKNTMRNKWVECNAVAMDFGGNPNNTSLSVYMYFINNNNTLTFNSNSITNVGGYKRLGFDVYTSGTTVNIGSVTNYSSGNISFFTSNGGFVTSSSSSRTKFIVQEKQKQSVTNNYYFTDLLTYYNFVFLDNYINYNNQYKTIGYLDGQDLNTHKFDAILYSDYGTVSENVVGRVNPYQNVNYNMYIPMYDNEHIYISVLSRLLVPNKQYYLRVFYDNDYDFEDNIYFTFQTDVSGNIINGDYNILNSTNDIIQNQNQNTQDVINEITNSGDAIAYFNDVTKGFSGDINDIVGQLNYIDYSGDFGGYTGSLGYVVNQIENVLMGSGDVIYTIPYMGTTITLNSRDFITPENGLKQFVRIFLIFSTVALILRYMITLLHRVQEGNVKAVVHQIAVNDESMLM